MHLSIHISAATVGTIPAMKQDWTSWAHKHWIVEYKQEMFSGINDKRMLIYAIVRKLFRNEHLTHKLTQAWWYLDEILLFHLCN